MSAKWTLGELRRYVADRELDACREVVQYLIERGPRVVDWEDERDRCEVCGELCLVERELLCAECAEELSGDEP